MKNKYIVVYTKSFDRPDEVQDDLPGDGLTPDEHAVPVVKSDLHPLESVATTASTATTNVFNTKIKEKRTTVDVTILIEY